MNKKKITLTILLSTLLALLVAFCVLEFSKKPKLIETQTTTENEIQEELPQSIENNKIIKQEINTSSTVTKKAVTVSKPSKQTVKKVEEKIAPQEDGVIVPVNYVSKNTYKYTYTPKKYPKKVLK